GNKNGSRIAAAFILPASSHALSSYVSPRIQQRGAMPPRWVGLVSQASRNGHSAAHLARRLVFPCHVTRETGCRIRATPTELAGDACSRILLGLDQLTGLGQVGLDVRLLRYAVNFLLPPLLLLLGRGTAMFDHSY